MNGMRRRRDHSCIRREIRIQQNKSEAAQVYLTDRVDKRDPQLLLLPPAPGAG